MFRVSFDQPWLLTLLLVVPLAWWCTRRSLSALGHRRRLVALVLRSVVLTLVILALAEIQIVRTNDQLSVLYLLDQSLSIPAAAREEMAEVVNRSVAEQREGRDRAGVIVFGREAAVEIPPFDANVQVGSRSETVIDAQYTNLAEAFALSAAVFPRDSAKRVVVLSDGNENLGDALTQARALSEAGVGIDVVPVELNARQDVAVEKAVVDTEVRRGQPFDMRVVLNNAGGRPVRGKLRITRRSGDRVQTLAEQDVALEPGKRVLAIRQQSDEADFFQYEARFVPDAPGADAVPQNNTATAYTFVRGRPHVLLIEDWEHPGQFARLVAALRRENLNVTVQTSDVLFTSLAELQRYDVVILANVPRTSGGVERLTNFTNDQIDMLVKNTQHTGGGLIMVGGSTSFGAGGWSNTELEKAMPVDFQVKNPKVIPSGALVLVVDKSSSMNGDKIKMCRIAAAEAVKVLNSKDHIGVVAFDSIGRWIVPMQLAQDRRAIAHRVSQLQASGGTNMFPGMQLGYEALRDVEASIKHMIVLSDGRTHHDEFLKLTDQMRADKIGVSTVAVGRDADKQLLGSIASRGGGKYYHVNSPLAIPRIFIKEAMRVTRPLVYERKEGIPPSVVLPHEMLKGVEQPLAPIRGFVLTTVKDNPLVEVSIRSPQPAEQEHATLLASWQYGAGRAVAITTDAGARWTDWQAYQRLYNQIVRWSMRRTGEAGNFLVAGEVDNGRGKITVTALDQQDEYLNFLPMTGGVVGPDRKPVDFQVRQVAPGRYVGEFDASDAGNYFVMVNPGGGRPPIRAGLNVPYSQEYRDRESNLALLEAIARLQPAGGRPGQIAELRDTRSTAGGPLPDPFRRDLPTSTTSREAWYLLVFFGTCVFFADVFHRRVHVDGSWAIGAMARVRDKLLRRRTEHADDRIERLRRRKTALNDQLAAQRAAVRFEPAPDAAEGAELPRQEKPAAGPKPEPARPAVTPEQPAADSYTERLLKAKRKVWEGRDRR